MQSYRPIAKPCDHACMTIELSKSVLLSLSKDQFSPPKKSTNYPQ